VCSHLIGRPYEYGGNDCIRLVIDALNDMGMNPPPFNPDWYTMTPRQVLQDLRRFCTVIDEPIYDGDIAILTAAPLAFGVTWQQGLLYINNLSKSVDWKPAALLSIRRCYRLKSR
jgi:hypothetical protein